MKHVHRITALILCWIPVSTTSAQSPVRPGDRVAIVGNTFADQLRMHGYLETLLLLRSSENSVSVRNLGWGGDMLNARDRPTNFPTEESTLTAHKTDVIIACFGMGESFQSDQGIDEFKSQLRAFIASHQGQKYNGMSDVRLVLVSPIACEDLGRLTPHRERRNQDLETYTDAMREVASAANLPFIDLFTPTRYLMNEDVGPDLTTNGIHLRSYGYWAISRTLSDQLIESDTTANPLPWKLTIDAAQKTSESRGVKIVDLFADESGVRFQVEETTAPSLAPPTDTIPPPQLQLLRDRLVVKNLEPGKYRLTVDGMPVVTADAKGWSEGVAIDSTPVHKSAEAYREAVNDKNLQFTYSWKALNQVHIVGERKTSPSGKELPKEVIEFNKLANKLDAALQNGIELKTRTWRVTRVTD